MTLTRDETILQTFVHVLKTDIERAEELHKVFIGARKVQLCACQSMCQHREWNRVTHTSLLPRAVYCVWCRLWFLVQ